MNERMNEDVGGRTKTGGTNGLKMSAEEICLMNE